MIINLSTDPTDRETKPLIYEMPQRGWHAATITDVEDLGIVHHDVWGDSHKMKISIRLDDELTTTGWPKIVCFWCPVSDSPRSKLGRFLRQLGLVGEVDTDSLVGMEISAKVIWTLATDGTGKTWAKVGQVSTVKMVNQCKSLQSRPQIVAARA